MSPKQSKIMEHLRRNSSIDLATAVELIGGDIYTNKKFHVGNVLSNMVKRGMINRVKPGLFEPAIQDTPDLFL